MPGSKAIAENMATSFNQGLDTGVIFDSLSQRLRSIEVFLSEELGCSFNYDVTNIDPVFQRRSGIPSKLSSSSSIAAITGSSPLRIRKSSAAVGSSLDLERKLTDNKMRKLEESLYEMRSQLQDCESEIQQVKSTVISRLRLLNNSNSPVRDNSSRANYHENDYSNNINNQHHHNQEEIRILQKKLKKLAENTTRACKSLSSGLTDVQQATLNLYSWSDTAHGALGKISHQMGFKENICPRARVYNPVSDTYTGQIRSF